MIAPSFPKIAPAEAIDDTAWFDARPSRRFRARRTPDGFWLVRKSGRVPADLQPERRARRRHRSRYCDPVVWGSLARAAIRKGQPQEQASRRAPHGRAEMSARLTVLTSVSGLYATKRIRQDRKTGKFVKTDYGREKHFRARTVGFSGFAHFCRCLERLTQCLFDFVIRGEPLAEIDLQKARRLLHDDPETGEAATFTEASRSWFAVDLDKVTKPVAIDPITDPDGAIEHLIGLLPPKLHDASCWWQFTCSQNLPRYEETLSARLWFWVLAPLDDTDATLGPLWYATAYPAGLVRTAQKRARAAGVRRGRRP
jgi:hypothetical protein